MRITGNMISGWFPRCGVCEKRGPPPQRRVTLMLPACTYRRRGFIRQTTLRLGCRTSVVSHRCIVSRASLVGRQEAMLEVDETLFNPWRRTYCSLFPHVLRRHTMPGETIVLTTTKKQRSCFVPYRMACRKIHLPRNVPPIRIHIRHIISASLSPSNTVLCKKISQNILRCRFFIL